jgi:quinoprotein glucose dehydrogenase
MRLRAPSPDEHDTIQGRYVIDRSASLRVRATMPDSAGNDRTVSLPIGKPPYGTLVAIDLNTGDHRWEITIGDTPGLRNDPLLRGLNLPPLGVAGSPGPIVTAGGLVFLTGGGATLFAVDKSNGRILWEADLGTQGYAVPMTYATRDGRQFVVIATGSGNNAVLRAFALPD